MAFRFDVSAPLDKSVAVVTMEIPLRELYTALNDKAVTDAFFHRTLNTLCAEAERKIKDILSDGTLDRNIDRMVAEAIKKEVMTQIKAAVEERVAEFFGDDE